ncbi:PD-(D/E)XK nuclease family protein [Candidatus Pacearchaeota archaeon]|nr:PD-(D/E)XK nuclease family protein [Candidatus Pacearchaeota archaeon]
MKTEEQIKKEIEALKIVRPNVRPRSMFGDDNLAAVDAQIAVLENDWGSSDIYDEYDRCAVQESILESALYARQWIDDKEDPDDGSLAKGWPLKEGGDTCQKKLILSASSIGAFKSCPIRFRNAYVYGIRKIEDSESQRVGTNWHLLLETAALVPGSDCPCNISDYSKDYDRDTECPICESTGKVPDDIMEAVTRVLNRAYEGIEFNDPEAKEVERVTLLHALAGYRWHYGDTLEPVVAIEQYFSLPLLNPQTGHPVPDVFIKGRIDKLIEIANSIAVKEHKSTSKSIDPDSTYWGHLNLDVQTTMYIYAARRMQMEGSGPVNVGDSLINTVKYDVYHKPTIRPKKLTQGDSKKFVKDGMYCGQEFEVIPYDTSEAGGGPGATVNDIKAVIEPGSKPGTFAIRETPDMFGVRLLKDITERPEFYFRCIELTRTDAELKVFEQELYDIAQNMRFMIRSGRFYTNEHQCEATFRCDYIGQCYNRKVVDQDHVPDGFKCIFRKDGE